jgi:hypothetical protein
MRRGGPWRFGGERLLGVQQRLMRRRANRFERGLPLSLTTPVPPEAVAGPLPPAEEEAATPRPASATLAACLLGAMGVALGLVALLDVGPDVLSVLAEPAVDGITQIVLWLVAAFVGGILVALLVVAGVHVFTAWRMWRGVNWSWVEGLGVSVIGVAFYGIMAGVTDDGEFILTPALILSLGVYAAIVIGLIAARPWFPPVRLSLDPGRAPWWLRLPRRWL